MQWDWNIARLQHDIDTGALSPKRQTLERAFIEAYATGVLALDRDPAVCAKRVSLLMRIDLQFALALPLEALDQPLIMLRVPREGAGVLRLEGDTLPNHVLGDGNHRIARAFFAGRESLDTHVLTSSQSREYLA